MVFMMAPQASVVQLLVQTLPACVHASKSPPELARADGTDESAPPTGVTTGQAAVRTFWSLVSGARSTATPSGRPGSPPPAWPYGTGQDASLVRSTGK